uniref:Uncharacterized protein n=1 Tax=Anguilla anguilla TaxID=7936 RepID=A0A0E9Q3P8_ANGAN
MGSRSAVVMRTYRTRLYSHINRIRT